MEPRSGPGSGTENHTCSDLVSRQLILSLISTTTSGSFLTTVNHCQSAAWVRQSALGACIPLRQVVPSITENETEVSLFNRDLYENFKLNPQVRPSSLTMLWVFHISAHRLDGNVDEDIIVASQCIILYSRSNSARNGSI
jgi:hypothetical protein